MKLSSYSCLSNGSPTPERELRCVPLANGDRIIGMWSQSTAELRRNANEDWIDVAAWPGVRVELIPPGSRPSGVDELTARYLADLNQPCPFFDGLELRDA